MNVWRLLLTPIRLASAVYINEVIDGGNVWEYNVNHSGRDGDLGTAADLETAKQIAFAFMNDSVASV